MSDFYMAIAIVVTVIVIIGVIVGTIAPTRTSERKVCLIVGTWFVVGLAYVVGGTLINNLIHSKMLESQNYDISYEDIVLIKDAETGKYVFESKTNDGPCLGYYEKVGDSVLEHKLPYMEFVELNPNSGHARLYKGVEKERNFWSLILCGTWHREKEFFVLGTPSEIDEWAQDNNLAQATE